MTLQSPVLEVKNLTKRYGKHLAVDDISFTLNSGEIVGFLGPNGAGKTTTTSMLLGLLEPTYGQITIFGKSLAQHRNEIASRMNFSASFSWLPGNLTVQENLYIFSLLYGVKNPRQKITQELARVGLEGFAAKKSGTLSSGEQSRLCLAKALLNDPELLLLDEPTSSLDPQSARDVRGMVRTETDRRGMAVLWTSHNMHEVEAICDRVLFLSKGRIFLEGNPKTLPQMHGKENLEELFPEKGDFTA